MQKLALAGNQLSEIPTTLSACKNLGLLRISANQLTQFPTWLFTMPKLSWLAFAGNPFCYKPIIETNLSEIHWNNLSLQHQLGQGASGIISKAIWQKNNDESIEVAVKEFKGAITSDGLPEDEMNACILADNHKNLIPLLGKITNHAHKKEGLV
jgi:Leucine-rich repeat (LRR) protein